MTRNFYCRKAQASEVQTVEIAKAERFEQEPMFYRKRALAYG